MKKIGRGRILNQINIYCKIFVLFMIIFVLTNVKTVNARELTQPIVGTITSINSGTERIVDILEKEPENKKGNDKTVNVRNSSNDKKIEEESDIEIFYPPSELKRDNNSSYKYKNQKVNIENESITEKNNILISNSKHDSNNVEKTEPKTKTNDNNSAKTKIAVAVGGGVLKVDTGNGGEVKNKISGVDIGFIRELKTTSGKLSVGGIVDYSHNDYDIKNTNGNGKSEAITFGIVAKQSRDDGVYYEGSVRLGRAKTDLNANSISIDEKNIRINYDESAPVYAGHAKLGKIIKNGEKNYTDIYGMYIFSHQDKLNAKLSTNEKLRFGSIDSNVLRSGCRMTTKVKDGKIYYGLAYQYETSAKVKATQNDRQIDVSSGRGGNGLVELGYELSANKDKTLNVDLNATGFAGRQKGFIIQAKLVKMI